MVLNVLNSLKFLTSSAPAYVIFWVTQKCNFTCKHCFNYLENAKAKNDLSLDEVRQVSGHMKHIKYLTLSGGEPFLRRDLPDVARIFHQQNDLHILNIVTNGWFRERTVAFAREVLESCPGLHLSVAVSVDGPKAIHDRIREKEGSYDRAVATIESLKALASTRQGQQLTVVANATYNTVNASVMQGFVESFSEKTRVPLYVAYVRGNDIQEQSLRNVDIDHFRQLRESVSDKCNEGLSRNYPFRRLRLAVDATVLDIIHDSSKHDKMTVPCKAGKRGFVLTANGDILLCEILNIRLGNVRDHDYDPLAILNLPESQEEMRKIVENRCHCTWECFQSMNVVHSPRLYPRVLKKVIQQALPSRSRVSAEAPCCQPAH